MIHKKTPVIISPLANGYIVETYGVETDRENMFCFNTLKDTYRYLKGYFYDSEDKTGGPQCDKIEKGKFKGFKEENPKKGFSDSF